MNLKFTKQTVWAFVVPVMLMSFPSCKKDDSSGTTDNNTPPAKTLNKATIAPKKWYSQGSSTIHDFKAGGVYGSNGGTWSWVGNSDTMIIVTKSGFPEVKWKIYYNTDHEMNTKRLDNNIEMLFKDAAW